MTIMRETDFERELKIFAAEEETAQQYFFSYLLMRDLPAQDTNVLRAMNSKALFWITNRDAMLLSAIVALGRIFDQNSKHNIDRLMTVAGESISEFSMKALAARLMAGGLPKEDADAYVADRHELTYDDLRALRTKIAYWRRVYEDRYRDIRDKFYAHRELSTVEEANDLMATTNIKEMKHLFSFLSGLEGALAAAFNNGNQPLLNEREFILWPEDTTNVTPRPGEKVYRQGYEMLKSLKAVSPS
jgi:hypothetical protein